MFLICWVMYICLLKSTRSQRVSDVTIISQYLNSDSNEFNMTCVISGDDMDSAITWNQPIPKYFTDGVYGVSDYIPSRNSPYNCKINNESDVCNQYWVDVGTWKLQNSLDTTLRPVTDQRWEGFKLFHTDGISYKLLKYLSDGNDFRINLSVRAGQAQIFLCNGRSTSQSSCYLIILGNPSSIRRCLYARPCNADDIKQSFKQSLVNTDEWNHFTIGKNDKKLTIWKLQEKNPILNIEYNYALNTPYLFVFSGFSKPGYWKLHNYAFISTKQETTTDLGQNMYITNPNFCMSIYVAMCGNCLIRIQLHVASHPSGPVTLVGQVDIKPKKAVTWQEEIIKTLLPINIYLQIRVVSICTSKCKYPLWAIDDFKICSENEIRVLTIEQQPEIASCQVIKYEGQSISQTSVETGEAPGTSCPNTTFGRKCIACSIVLGASKPYCNSAVICNMKPAASSICTCAAGYDPPNCSNKCPEDKYGVDCSEDCGSCEVLPCDKITGECIDNKCLIPFKGPRCKESILPILLKPPDVIKFDHTSLTVKIQNNAYEGEEVPVYYKIEYQVKNEDDGSISSWKETESHLFQEEFQPIKIENLEIFTTYVLKATLISATGSFYNGRNVPKVTAKTTCKVIEERDVEYATDNTTITLEIKSYKESCSIDHYEISLNDANVKANSFKLKISMLQPFTNYELTIRNTLYNKTVTLTIQTTEGVPSSVQQIKILKTSATTIFIGWQPPLNMNGIIRHYKVKYKHLRYLGCEKENVNGVEGSFQETTTNIFILIKDLLPYSEYIIEIIAAVTNADGEQASIIARTSATESLDSSEIPIITKVKAAESSANVILEISNCTFIKGPSIYYLSWQCSNEWCQRQQPNSKNTTDISKPIYIYNLLPYSNYTLEMQVERENGNSLRGKGSTANFVTGISVPNTIQQLIAYSKTKNSISLYLSPPYPPTGEIEEYGVDYCYNYRDFWGYSKTSCEYGKFIPKSCKVWPSRHCLFLKNLKENEEYDIKVKAKNKNSKFNQPTSIKAYTAQEPPEILQDFSYKWDDYYNLSLRWNHPEKENGPLTRFVVRINSKGIICNESYFLINEDNYKLNYNYVIPLENCYSSMLRITAAAVNIREGPPSQLYVTSPPKTPSFTEEPTIQAVTNTTIVINLPTIINFQEKSVMYIIISTMIYKPQATTDIDIISDIKRKLGLPVHSFSWIVAEFEEGDSFKKDFIVGDNMKSRSRRLNTELYNSELRSDMIYTINIVLENEYEGLKRHKIYKSLASTSKGEIIEQMEQNEESQSSNNGLFALLLLLLLPIILYVIFRNKELKFEFNVIRFPVVSPESSLGRTRSPDVIPLASHKENIRSPPTQVLLRPKKTMPINRVISKAEMPSTSARGNFIKSFSEKANSKFSKPIKIADFEKYVKESIENGELETQHQLFPRGQTKPWDYGLLPQNKSKNRYNNLVAYDHTRVKLTIINNDPYSDYINASYIESYNTKKAYIATQGPKVATVNDFWRMVWQENVFYIVMLANTIEGGKKKSEQYWPNVDESLEFGAIRVTYVSSRIFADYEYRTFTVINNYTKRTIEQLHFTSWPDHGVPLYSQSLVPFLRKLLTIPQGTSPIVVHCSAGVGRTGTIILCDLCLRMAAREGEVDVLKHLQKLREQRANLVDNIEQYKLAHLVLLECLVALHTSITCDEKAEATILQMLETEKPLQQMQYINETAWQDQAMRPLIEVTHKPEWSRKNRFQSIIPSGYGRVYISRFPAKDEHSDYINAVEVDGFRCPQQFIVTQQPLKDTVSEFWRMIDEKEVTTAVSLNKISLSDESSCIFWPTEEVKQLRPIPYLTIQFHNKLDSDYFSTITIQMYNTKDKKNTIKRIVKLIILKGWTSNKLVPESEEALLKLWEETERIGRGENPIVVTCYDGAKACGLFIALSFVIEKIKLEQECDVCLAVRTIRRNRIQFVTEMEQFIFLYRATISYLRCFDLYSNFTTAGKH